MRKRTHDEKIIENTKIRFLYEYMSESKIAKKLHVSKSEVSKALRNKKFEKTKLERFYKSQMHALPKKSAGTNDKSSLNNAAKNSSKSNPKSTESDSVKSKPTNKIKKVPVENKSKVSNPASNPSNNVANKVNVSSPKLDSSVTNYQPTKTKQSSQAKKLPLKNEAKSTPPSSNVPKEISFMPYLTKNEKQDEHDIEVITNPREIDYFTLLQFMNLYTDIPHQFFVHKYWNILSKRLVHYYGTRPLRKAKRIQNRFKLKMTARIKAENGAKYIFNRIKNKFKKSSHNNKK